MSNKMSLIAIALVSIGLILLWSLNNTSDSSIADRNDIALPLPIPKTHAPSATAEFVYSPTVKTESSQPHNIKEPAPDSKAESWDEAAIDQMRDARLNGDDRAPPIVHDQVPEEKPTAEELASPELYNDYETRQEMKLKTAYVAAAQPEILLLKQQLKAMRDAGLDERSIREAEEKLIQLQAMTKRLQEQHPELIRTSSAVTN